MSVRMYLPSVQFAVIVGSLAVSGGLVAAAQYYTSSHEPPAQLASTADTQTQADAAWEQNLAEIQAQSGVTLPEVPGADVMQSLLAQAQSTNLTDSIGRGLLVKLTAAGTQGLGDDAPTQDQIIAEAAAQLSQPGTAKVYTQADVRVVATSPTTLRAYGNVVITALGHHPGANSSDTLLALAKATDAHNEALLAPLAPIGREYKALAQELLALPVPKTLAPLHLKIVQNISTIATLYTDMQATISDPLRGLTALQKYQSLMGETGRVFTNIAQALQSGGILFTKDEPGQAWTAFLSAP